MPRYAAAALLCSLALRWGAAVITEFQPIFPPHYYTDAAEFDKHAKTTVRNWETRGFLLPPVSPSSKLYTATVAVLYRFFGAQPLIPKLLNGLAATAALCLWYRIALLFVPEKAAALALWMLALWPSSAFFSSQNLKDAHILLLSAAVLFAFLLSIQEAAAGSRRRLAYGSAAGGAALMFLTGLYRPYLMLLLSAAALTALAAAVPAARREPRRRIPLAVILLMLAAPLAFYHAGMNIIFTHILVQEAHYATDPSSRILLLPATSPPNQPAENIRPFSPEGLTQFRKIRHSEDQKWAARFSGRRIHTQVFPDAEFHSWWDVARYLPRGTLYALFMPLPGFFPLEGKLGRRLAALENTGLLAAFLLAAAYWVKTPSVKPAPLALAAFFCLTALCYGLFEYDLGGATRHRPQYFPCLFIFAASFLHQIYARRNSQHADKAS